MPHYILSMTKDEKMAKNFKNPELAKAFLKARAALKKSGKYIKPDWRS